MLPLGGGNEDLVVAALERHKKFVRGELARRVSLRHTPELSFELDVTFSQSDAVNALAEQAANQWTARFNPRPVSEGDFRDLYRAAL